MKIFFVYYSTAGNSGLYLNSIYEALKNRWDVTLAVNYYYPFDSENTKKIYFKYTENTDENKWLKKINKKIRKVIRLFELVIGYVKTLIEVRKIKPEILNYSLVNMPFTEWFLRGVKLVSKNTKIVVTCHDVIPFQSTSHVKYDVIYNMAHFLLVHNEASIESLQNYYKIDNKKILKHPFPLMDVNSMINLDKRKINKVSKFLFIGVLREEKGVDILIDAWKKFNNNSEVKLTIAGFLPEGVNLNFNEIVGFENVKIILKKLSDYEYTSLINDNDCVILPYKQVGNSGVLSTIASMNRVVISSELPAFIESGFVNKKLVFENENSKDLVNIIEYASKMSISETNEIIDEMDGNYNQINENFNRIVNSCYEKIKLS